MPTIRASHSEAATGPLRNARAKTFAQCETSRLRKSSMSFRKTLITIGVAWLIAITLLHASLNLHLFRHEAAAAGGPPKFGVGFIPVTCHLTCPVTDFINQNMEGGSFFQPMRFNGFP